MPEEKYEKRWRKTAVKQNDMNSEIMNKLVKDCEDVLDCCLPDPDHMPEGEQPTATIASAMRYNVLAGGKRLRPLLFLATLDSLGKDIDQKAVQTACGIELIHTYSLIHDDLPAMDNDDYRRGKLTSHKKWGEVWFSQNGVAGIFFYTYVVLAAGGYLTGAYNLLLAPFVVLFVIVPVFCFLMKEPLTNLISHKPVKPAEGWGGYMTQNVFEVLEILLSFVTNSMSYLRVGGFVLSHAGMMLVVMTLVKMTGNAGPVVLVIGNAFVMVLEGLVVGIQALRLEYYEMFSRYYTGGGRKFAA